MHKAQKQRKTNGCKNNQKAKRQQKALMAEDKKERRGEKTSN